MMADTDYKASTSFLNDTVATPGLLASRIFNDQAIVEPFFGALLGTEAREKFVREYSRILPKNVADRRPTHYSTGIEPPSTQPEIGNEKIPTRE
nr:uncharacterized protein LOC109173786 [Ipomoea batatas]